MRALASLSIVVLAGCGAFDDPGARRPASGAPDASAESGTTEAPATNALYHLPWACGATYDTTQGWGGDLCGGDHHGDHVGVMEYAWDFGLARDTPVLAARDGVVTFAAVEVRAGEPCYEGCPDPSTFADCCQRCAAISNHVNVEHDDGSVSTYWHLDSIVVRLGQSVAAGDLLGFSGTSGCSTGPHLHFQVMRGCPDGWCQSIPAAFVESGDPACGTRVDSRNACR